jgi:hypothetical protein
MNLQRNHKWLAFLGVVALAVAIAVVTNHTAPQEDLHFESSAQDYARLGLTPGKIEAWEDGRRTPKSAQYFEWWYFDAVMNDGTIVVITFGDNWSYGSHTRNVALIVTPHDGKARRFRRSYTDAGFFAKDHTDVKMGPNTFVGDLNRYEIKVPAVGPNSVGCDLTLLRTAPSNRPATGYVSGGNKFFAWLNAVPQGKVEGTLTYEGKTINVSGSGYHDHNWGNAYPADLFESWWWGRARIGDRTVVIADMRATKAHGRKEVKDLFVANPNTIEINSIGSTLEFEAGPAVAHPDPAHQRSIASYVRFTVPDGTKVTFPVSDHLLASTNLLNRVSWSKRFAAKLLGMKPWYTRFESSAYIDQPNGATRYGQGTLERFEFR